jgi:hypothetical protein
MGCGVTHNMLGVSGTFRGNLPNLSKSSGLENHFPFNAGLLTIK